ncbi:MAG TPA: hypothetical protein VL003_03440 [Pusillimonas sp.]|uniref:DUF4870 family protein n=1 Tax=Pusillimonas sp. TaxID=3040095 RepID=UPI002B5728E0|nr:hypothetical protein [Pusillimonas sp.]HUH87087.1 hypothetical protein [Pusillimonas sp.]
MNNQITPAGESSSNREAGAAGKPDSIKTVATVVYALQAAAFFVGITAIVAVIIAHVKIGDSRGTWLESHFRWQIRTFWYSLLWCVVGLILMTIVVGYFVLVGLLVWTIYRIAKGWLRLLDGKAMYTTA